jgi:hypothetical protein
MSSGRMRRSSWYRSSVLATWIIRSKTSVSVMALSLTSPTYNI